MKGWKLVPVEPTPEMSSFSNTGVHFPIAERIYGAMLAAAPTPPAQPDELRKAAEEACVAIEAQEGTIRGDLFTAWKSLRAALEAKQ